MMRPRRITGNAFFFPPPVASPVPRPASRVPLRASRFALLALSPEQDSRIPEQDVCVDAVACYRQTLAPNNGAQMRFHPPHRWSLIVAIATLLFALSDSARAQA